MATPRRAYWRDTDAPPNDGAVSAVPVGKTVIAPVVRSPLRLWAASSTRTASVSMALKSPLNASVRVAVVAPKAAPDTCEMETPGIAVTSSKLAAVTPFEKVAKPSATRTVAPFRAPSVSGEGVVD